MAPPRRPPELIEDAITEILLRVPPDEPADLVRASLVCELWRRILTDPVFLSRYREFHCTPPLLGFYSNVKNERTPRFVPTNTAAFPVPQAEFDSDDCSVYDCRHGRVLLGLGSCRDGPDGFVVWDPITGDQHRLPRPYGDWHLYGTSAVLCAVASCNHHNCHAGPFNVVYMGSYYDDIAGCWIIQASVYSSETGMWAKSAASSDSDGFISYSTSRALIGDVLYFSGGERILKYELNKNCLSVFDSPDMCTVGDSLMQMEDGSIGISRIRGSSIYLRSRNVNPEGVVGWVQCKVIGLDKIKMLPPDDCCNGAYIFGSADNIGVMFIRTYLGVFTFDFKSGQARKVSKPIKCRAAIPFTSFYTPDCASKKLPSPVEAH